jgi:hypothetical protein
LALRFLLHLIEEIGKFFLGNSFNFITGVISRGISGIDGDLWKFFYPFQDSQFLGLLRKSQS